MKKCKNFPVITIQDEDNMFIAECPLFDGCYTQSKTMEEALKNITEVIEMCLEEKEISVIASAAKQSRC